MFIRSFKIFGPCLVGRVGLIWIKTRLHTWSLATRTKKSENAALAQYNFPGANQDIIV